MSEHQNQAALIEWARLQEKRYPELARLYAVPNGGKRHIKTAMALWAEGARAGVLDLCLPVARHGYHSMYLEMKYGKNKLTEEQAAEIVRLRADGFYVPEPCYAWQEAAKELVWYLTEEQGVLRQAQDAVEAESPLQE